jgi:hypothetical protein
MDDASYKLSFTILQAYTKCHPFHGPKLNDIDVIKLVLSGSKPDHYVTSGDRQLIPDDLWCIMQQCWDSNADRRPTSEDLVKLVDRLIHG